MSEQSYYFLSTYNLLTAIYSRYLWDKVSPCGQGIGALCGRREIFVRTEFFLCAQKFDAMRTEIL